MTVNIESGAMSITIANFDMSPNKLQIELLRYEIFHLRSSMTKKLLFNFKDIINVYDYDILQIFFRYFDNL